MRVLLLLAVLALLLPACGNQTTGDGADSGTTPKNVEKPAAPEGGGNPGGTTVADEGGDATTRTLVLEVEGMT